MEINKHRHFQTYKQVGCHIMKRTTYIFITFLLLQSCSKNSFDQIHVITYKWNAQIAFGQTCEACQPNSDDCCEVNYNGEKYVKSTSFKFDKNGKIIQIYSYHVPLGVNIYTPKEYLDLGMSDSNFLKQKTTWNRSTNSIIDNGVIIKNFRIDENAKKLYLKSNNRLTIYEYE